MITISIELYKFNNKNFNKAGDIVLRPSKCILTIELHTGLNEIELTHPLDQEGRWEYINKDDVISVQTCYLKIPKQLYRIYESDKNMSSITVKARHIFYDLIDTVLIDVRPTNLSGEEALNYILQGTRYKGHSDIEKESTSYFVRKNVIEAIGGDKENSFMARWGGELFVNNFDIYINEKVGLDNRVTISYGKNLTEVEESITLENVVTRAIPVGYNGIMLEGNEPWVDSPLINNYANIKMKVISYDDIKVKESSDDTDGFDTIEEARAELIKRVNKDYENGLDKPLVNYSVKFLDLSKIDEYKDYKILEEVLLGDTVHIKHKRLGIDLEARVIKLEYNCLTGKMENIELGNYLNSYAKEKADNSITIDNINNSFDDDGNLKGSNIKGAINAIKSPLLAQKDSAVKTDVVAWKTEVTNPDDPNFGCMVSGSKGLLIANKRTPDGRDWDYRTAISADGVVADWIIGKLKTVLIENADGSFKIDLNKTGGADFFNNGKLAMNISNNSLNLYDWANNGKFIGGLFSATRTNDKSKALIQLANSDKSGISIAYPLENGKFASYIEFDIYNVLNNNMPISILANVSLNNRRLYFGSENKMFITNINNYLIPVVQNGFAINTTDSKTCLILDVNTNTLKLQDSSSESLYAYINKTDFSFSNKLFTATNGAVAVANNLGVNGDLTVVGQKNRVVKTEHYGDLKQNAYETCEPYFADIGRGKLKNGKCIIRIDHKFLETVNTDIQYEVKTWAYGKGIVYVNPSKMYKQYVVIEGTEDIEFGYEIIAKQKGYENIRLEEFRKEFVNGTRQ